MIYPTQNYIKEIFDYKDGNLIWKVKFSDKVVVGSVAGCRSPNGYITIRINKKGYYAHRLILIWHGISQFDQVDHINGNKNDNRIENLRPSNSSTNQLNQKIKKTNSSGHKNVHWVNRDNRWQVVLRVDGIKKYIGSYLDIEQAKIAAINARNVYHKEFANHS